MPELFFVNENKKINVDTGVNLRKASIDGEVGIYSNIFKKFSLSNPGSIGCKKDIVILPGYFINPIFGHT